MQRLPNIARSAAAVRSAGRVAALFRGWKVARAASESHAWSVPASQRFLSVGASQAKEARVNLIIEPAANKEDPPQVLYSCCRL